MEFPVRIVQHGPDWVMIAAMIQAFGSILAICVAIAIPWTGGRRQRLQLYNTVVRHGQMIRDAVQAMAIYAGIEPVVANKYGLQLTSIEIKLPLVLEAAMKLPLEQLQHADANEAFVRLIGCALTFESELKRFNAGEVSQYEETVNGVTMRRAAYQQVCARFDELERLLVRHPYLPLRRGR